MSPDGEGEDAESPMPNPSQISQTVRRRGAISAEPITEEDVATYVKKVRSCQNNVGQFLGGWIRNVGKSQ